MHFFQCQLRLLQYGTHEKKREVLLKQKEKEFSKQPASQLFFQLKPLFYNFRKIIRFTNTN